MTASMNGSATARSRCPLLVKLPATMASGKSERIRGIRRIHERDRLPDGEGSVAVAQEDGDRARDAIDHGQVDLPVAGEVARDERRRAARHRDRRQAVGTCRRRCPGGWRPRRGSSR